MKSLAFLIVSLFFMQMSVHSNIFLLDGKGKSKNNTSEIIVHGQTIDSLFKIMQAMVYSDPDSTRVLAFDALEKIIEVGNAEWQIRILNLLGSTFVIQSNHIQAFEYYHQALKLAMQSNNFERIGDSYNNLGVLNLSIKNNKDALENLLAAIQNYESASAHDKVNVVHCNIGILYLEHNNVEKAFFHFRNSQTGFLNDSDSVGLAILYSYMGASFLEIGQIDSAFLYTDKSIDISTQISDFYTLAFAYSIKGAIFLRSENFEAAAANYNQSIQTAGKINDRNIISVSHIGLAKINIERKDYDKALYYANKALDEISSNTELEYKVNEVFSKIYEQTGDYKRSLSYYKIADEIKAEINDRSKLHQLYYLEISQLIKDKEIQRLEIERQKLSLSRRNSLILLLGLLSITIIVIMLLIYNNHLNKIRQAQRIKLNEATLKHAEERSKAALEAEIQERKRLGLELHDGVGPMLSLAKLNVTSLLKKQQINVDRRTTILENTLGIINEVLKEMKQISHNMAPVVLIEKGFEAAIRSLVNKLNETNDYQVSLDIHGLNGGLEPYFEHAMYRSILEIINNIIHHAHGTEINIQIIQNNEDLTIMIEDNGVGFDISDLENGKGLGLKSTTSRIESLKGQLFIDSSIGKGVIVSMIVPLNHN